MESSPARQQRSGLGGVEIAAWRQEFVVRGHDNDESERHYYADHFEMRSPLIAERGFSPTGVLRGEMICLIPPPLPMD